jgi:N-acetylmuramoyl-L-alanine amidase
MITIAVKTFIDSRLFGWNTGICIMLDAGHSGRYNRSPAMNSYYESEVMWTLHLMLRDALKEYGFKVNTTRSNINTDMAPYDRGRKAKGYDLVLSLHSNSAGKFVDESVDYPLVIIPFSSEGQKLATQLAIR